VLRLVKVTPCYYSVSVLIRLMLCRVKIGDKNDNPPVFNLPHYTATIEESSMVGKRVKQVYATDRDAGNNGRVEYFLKDDPSGFFVINQNSGWVSVARPMSGVSAVQFYVVFGVVIFESVYIEVCAFILETSASVV